MNVSPNQLITPPPNRIPPLFEDDSAPVDPNTTSSGHPAQKLPGSARKPAPPSRLAAGTGALEAWEFPHRPRSPWRHGNGTVDMYNKLNSLTN